MRVCLIAELASLHTRKWAEGLARTGCDIHVLSKSTCDENNFNMINTEIYSPNLVRQIMLNRKNKRIVLELQPDIVHLFGLFSLHSLGAMLLAANFKPLVVSVWGTDIVPAPGRRVTCKQRKIKRYLLEKADAVLPSSNYLAEETEKYLSDRSKTKVIHWGVDLEQYAPAPVERGNSDTVTVGFAKTLHALSGPDILMRAFAIANNNCRNRLKLRIAGDGAMRKELEELSVELGIRDLVDWLGWLHGHSELLKFYHSIDVYAMPSRREALGMSAIEASACGVPIVASRFGGIPEIVEEGVNGLLVEPENENELACSIVRLAVDHQLRTNMGDAGRKLAEERFDWDQSVLELMNIYHALKK